MIRIGQGFDMHRLGPGDSVVLGGLSIPCEKGIVAHSDGDVLLHALCDAVLGAAGLGDMGEHFPDSDARWKNADSRMLLRRCVELAAARNLRPLNADLTLIAEIPRVAEHSGQMRANVAADLAIDETAVNLKATSAEGLGPLGQKEGIAALAAVLLQEREGD